MLTFANNFLAGSIITLLIPACMFIVIAAWYTYSVLRLGAQRHGENPDLPGPRQPEASGLTATGEDPPGAAAQ